MGKLVKKLILILSFYGLSEAAKAKKQTDIANAHQANPTLVPGLTPTPATVLGMITTQNNYYTQRDTLMEQMKQVTENIHKNGSAINDIFIDQWRSQTQVAIGGDASKAKLLGYGIKGVDTGHITTTVALEKGIAISSRPVIVDITVNTHLMHILHIHNNITGKRRLPKGILRIDIYGQTGGAAPTDYSLMGRALGQASRGKFVHTFQLADVGKIQYYIAVYIDKKTKQPVAQSLVVSGIIN